MTHRFWHTTALLPVLMASLLFLLLSLFSVSHAGVLPGVERLLHSPYLELVAGKRVGVLAHFASRMNDGTHVVDWLHSQRQLVDLRMIFSPEHGFRGGKDVDVPDSKDPATGLRVFSLYGPRREPTAAQLAELDVVLIDLQDVGVRFYTYSATVGWLLHACARAGKKVILLDRPNPLGLGAPEGPVLEHNFVGGITTFYPSSMRHGMTLGELALLYNRELALGADLTVVPVQGLTRSMSWGELGLTWFASSPALTTPEQALLYGIFGVLETLNFAVGRGQTNEQAFRIYGAPWITHKEAVDLVRELTRLGLPGLTFKTVEWVPTRREYEGRRCFGFRVLVTAPQRIQGFTSLLEVMKTLKRMFGRRLVLSGADGALGMHWVRKAIELDEPTAGILERVREESRAFFESRARVLLY
jgi:uncharacterized protein YbbC (DUF1343 family)